MADLARIKNNVRKMAAQGAPEQDIDGYIASEGVTVDDVRGFSASGHNAPEYVPPGVEGYNPETGMVEPQYGKAGSAAMGAADATTFGFGDELASTVAAGLESLPGRSGLSRSQILAQMRGNQDAAQAQNPGSYLAGQVGGGVAQALATGGGGFAANAARSGGSLGRVALGSGLDGAAYLGLQGAGGGTDLESRAKGAGWGAVIGGATGLAAPYIVAGLSKAAQKAVSPFATSADRTAAAKFLGSEGVPLTAGQKTGSKALRYAESEIGGDAAANIMEDQGRAFTDAAMRKAGGNGLADPDTLAALKGRLGKEFEDLSARNTLRLDQGIVDDMTGAAQEYARVLPADQKAIFQNLGDDIIGRFKAGKNAMSGKDYQTIRSRLTRMAKNYRNSDGEFSDAIRGLRDALDNGMERSIQPADKGAWSGLRQRYGNYKVLEKAANGGGEDAALGIISPARLRMAASSGNQSGFATGKSDFTKLAKAGQAVMTPLPNSGTASRLAVRNLGAMAPSIVGAGAGGAYGAQDGGGLQGALAGALAGFVAPRVVGKMMMSKQGQRYLANQLLKSGSLTAEKRALINAVLTYGGSAATGRLAP
ncbi:hypothetical protein CO731_04856 [Aminobacter sp. MSH1]|uniref:hypothetical protein n=1 Tax=Aminobacter sp. MSH1 TaxID=374606 RepID=UPI000D3536C6|nr:hypothetical protein [Aminobacter sp. MSH1]AWC25361.1 hypothetical protein CO731_04856 [Aminobacter sp. MSH1]